MVVYSSTSSVSSSSRTEQPKQQSSSLMNFCSKLFTLKQERGLLDGKTMRPCDVFPDSKPYVRWWWLNGPFNESDIKAQLKWLKNQGFGGVELAWLFPSWDRKANYDSPGRVKWLSEDFKRAVTLTKKYAQKLGLGCDFTFGSCWPFGGTFLRPEDRSQTFKGPSTSRIGESWEKPEQPYVLNHLSRTALEHYVEHMRTAFQDSLQGRPSSLFCDSLELDSDNAWSPELWKKFEERHGYSLADHLGALKSDPNIRYDIRKILSETIVANFYQSFTDLSHQLGARTRVQCHGAPVDLLSAYAAVDVPESESLLFDPWFSRIPASAGCLASRPVVSCETFTCMYGFPDKHFKKEQIGDLKLLFDAVVANGVNQIVWHGMPFNPVQKPTNAFFASVHVGPDASFADQLPAFNHYMETVCGIMRLGRSPHQIAVYLPNEDMMMRGELSREQQSPGACLHWEMRHVHPGAETQGFLPLWLSGEMLSKVSVKNGNLCCGDMNVPILYIDVEWLDRDALSQLLRLLKDGGKIVLKNIPKQPGFKPSDSYDPMLQELISHPNTLKDLKEAKITPLLEGEQLPPYWAREYEGNLYLFFAHPDAGHVTYPMRLNQYQESKPEERRVAIHVGGKRVEMNLQFAPVDSIMVRLTPDGKAETLNLGFQLKSQQDK